MPLSSPKGDSPEYPMAVPKKRTSRTRRDKRRATHKVSAPRLNECPRCHSPRLPHRVCPTCGTYAGREVISHEVEDTAPVPAAAEPQE
jgi:large subunit ribosomal protein L32